jgi:DNA polymerase alpha subunit A
MQPAGVVSRSVRSASVDAMEVAGHFAASQKLLGLVRHNENDAYLTLKLMFKLEMIPLTLQLTNLAGNLWCVTVPFARACA